MNKLLLFAAVLAITGCNANEAVVKARSIARINKPVKSEKGWTTDRVVANYWPKSGLGYSLEFKFPKNDDDADREEVIDTFRDFGCDIYQGGGYPGAPAYVTCDSVEDTTSADAKLKELVPALDNLMFQMSISSGPLKKSQLTLEREAKAPKTMTEWLAQENAKHLKCPEDGFTGGGGNGYDSWSIRCENGVTVYQDTTKETQKRQNEENEHNSALANALVSRCLTAKEFAEVTSLGYYIYVRPMETFYEEGVRSRFNAALQTQQILQQRCPSPAGGVSR